MGNSFEDVVDNQLKQLKRQFKLDVLKEYDPDQWPKRIDYIARRAANGSYTIGIQSGSPRTISDGETLDKAAHDHYLTGIAKLTGNTRYRTALPSEFRLGSLLVQYAGMRSGMESVGHDTLEPGEVLGRLLTRNLKRNVSGDTVQLAEQLPPDIRTPRSLVSELCAVPELADTVEAALPNQASVQSLADQLANVDLTTQLWDHQFEALRKWLQNDCNGYVNMATATGKTVLGLAAVAYCVDAGSLHPADQDCLREALPTEIQPTASSQSKHVLIVTTDELLGVQWGRLFQTHCHTPPEFTKVTNGSIRLPWGRIDIKSASGLEDVDPSNYRLAIFDEVHNYTKSGGWGSGLRRFVDSPCPVLALTGSVTEELDRLTDQVETDFPEVYTYTHTDALSDGVIPDFEWTLSFVDIDRESSTLESLERTAKLAEGIVDFHPEGVAVDEHALSQRFSGVSQSARNAIAGSYETGPQLASAIREAGDEEDVGPTDELEALASGLSNRSIHRLNLDVDNSVVIQLAENALERERPVLILTRSYNEAKEIWQALYDNRSDRVVKKLNRDASAAEQDATITSFDEASTSRKVLIGPGKRIGQGNDIQSVEVGINISRPGSGVNASLVQRLGRLLRGAREKERVEFYHVSGVQPAASVLTPDGESFVRNVTEFFAQVLTPDTDGIHKPPEVQARGREVSSNVSVLEDVGAERVLASEQTTEIEKAYASEIRDRGGERNPTATTDWFVDAFPDAVEPTGNDTSPENSNISGEFEVAIDPVVFEVARLHVERDDYEHDSVEAVAEEALSRFLDAVDTAESRTVADAVNIRAEHTFTVSCDPALEVAIKAKMENAGMESPDEFVQHAVEEWLGIDSEASLRIANYSQYESHIDELVRAESYPCTNPGDVVQAALETYLDI